MILVDTSAWVEYLRDTGSPSCIRVGELLNADLATCDVVRMELLAGARDEQHRRDLRRLIARAALVPMEPGDFDQAAALYRRCRGQERPFALSSTASSARWPFGPTCRFCTATPTLTCSHGLRRCALTRHDR